MDKKHCSGCYNNFYNGNNQHGVSKCWRLDSAKIVWQIRIGNFENPPYKNKKKVQVPTCYRTGSCGDHFINPDVLTKEGYWK